MSDVQEKIKAIKESIRNNNNKRAEDELLLAEILQQDKNFPDLLQAYYYNDLSLKELFKGINDYKNCFYNTELITSQDNLNYPHNGSLYKEFLFDSHFENIKYSYGNKTTIYVTKQEKDIDNYDFSDLEEVGIKPIRIIDVELFEHVTSDLAYDLTEKLKSDEFNSIISHREKSDFIKTNKLNFEKEKIHFIFLESDFNNKTEYIPIYIGFGTNEYYGVTHSSHLDGSKNSKARWFKLDFQDKDNSFIEQGDFNKAYYNKELKNKYISNSRSNLRQTAVVSHLVKK